MIYALNQDALDAAYAAAPTEKRDMHLIASVIRAYQDKIVSQASDARAEIMRLMREDFDPNPHYELPEWDDNAEDVADKIVLAVLSESRIHISDAWRVVKKWLADYAEEEVAFSRYRGDVMLDGVMRADERRLLWAFLEAGKAPRTAYQAVERVLDENSAWIARPNREVTQAVALAAGIAYHLNVGHAETGWTRDDLAKGLAMLDGIALCEIKSTVGDPQDANNWREYLGRADDLLVHLSVASSDCAGAEQ